MQVRNLQDQGRSSFPADGVHLLPNLPGHPFGDQYQPHPGIGPALRQQLPGLGGIVGDTAGNPGQSEGQQRAGIGDEEKALVFDDKPLAAGCQWLVVRN